MSNGEPSAKRQKLEIPKGLGGHPPVILRFRPEGKTTVPKQLEYFCLQALGECARLLLEVTQTPYDSIMHFNGKAMKAYAPFGQLPLYRGDELGDTVLSQSGTICRHIAKMTGLDGRGPAEQAKVDSFFELAKDISGAKAAVHDSRCAVASKFEMFMNAAEKHSPGDDGFWVGSSLTLADVAMFHILYQLIETKMGCLDAYPKCKAFAISFMKRPEISAYLVSDRRIPLTTKEKGLPYEGEGYFYTTSLRPSVVAELYAPPST